METDNIFSLLRRAHQKASESLRSGPLNLTPSQAMAMLGMAEAADGISQNELGRCLGYDAATFQGVCRRLCWADLAQSHAHAADRRRLCWSLTDRGRQMVPLIRAAFEAAERQILEPLSEFEQKRIAVMLRKVIGSDDVGDGTISIPKRETS